MPIRDGVPQGHDIPARNSGLLPATAGGTASPRTPSLLKLYTEAALAQSSLHVGSDVPSMLPTLAEAHPAGELNCATMSCFRLQRCKCCCRESVAFC